MSVIKYMGQVATEMMEPHVGGQDVYYVQTPINSPSFACMDSACGLIWDRKHYAESCERRGHVARWSQGYGGLVENGVYKPAKTYPRTAIGRLSLADREPVSTHQHDYEWYRGCGADVCYGCGDHRGLARCYCGWAASGGNGRQELLDMGETLD